MSRLSKEQLVAELQKVIDHDEPPGLAARVLAAAVVELVRDRDAWQANEILEGVRVLAQRYQRPR